MKWLLDFLTAIPTNAVLREKLATAEAKVKELEAQNKILHAQIQDAQIQADNIPPQSPKPGRGW